MRRRRSRRPRRPERLRPQRHQLEHLRIRPRDAQRPCRRAIHLQDALVEAHAARAQVALLLRAVQAQQPGLPLRLLLVEIEVGIDAQAGRLRVLVQQRPGLQAVFRGNRAHGLAGAAVRAVAVVAVRHEDQVGPAGGDPGAQPLPVFRFPRRVAPEPQEMQPTRRQPEEGAAGALFRLPQRRLRRGIVGARQAVLDAAGPRGEHREVQHVPLRLQVVQREPHRVEVVGVRRHHQHLQRPRQGLLPQGRRPRRVGQEGFHAAH